MTTPAQATAYTNIYLGESFDAQLLAEGFIPVSTESEDMEHAVDAFGAPPLPASSDNSLACAAQREARTCAAHPVTLYALITAILTGSVNSPSAPRILLVGPPDRTEQVFEAAERAAHWVRSHRAEPNGRMALPILMGRGFLASVDPNIPVQVYAPVQDPDGVEHHLTLNLPDSFRFPGDDTDTDTVPDVRWDVDTGEVCYGDTIIGVALREIANFRYGGEFPATLSGLNGIDPGGYQAVMSALTLYSETEADPQFLITGDWACAIRHTLVAVLGWNVVQAEDAESDVSDG